jgi:MFS family permease
MVADLSGNLTVVTAAFSVHMLAYTVTAPWAGRIIDRTSPRSVIVVSALVSGAGLALLGLATSAWHAALLFGLIVGVFSNGFGVIVANRPLIGLFHGNSGLALGIANSGVAFGASTIPVLAGTILTFSTWRTAFVVIGLLLPAVLIPTALFAFPNDQIPRLSEQRRVGIVRSLLRRFLEDRTFRFLFGAFFVAMIAQQAIVVQLPGSGLLRDMSAARVGLAIGVLGATGMVARIGFAWLSDRLTHRLHIAIPGTGLVVVGMLLLWSTTTESWFWLAAAVIGAGMSIYGPLFGAIVGDLFPPETYGSTLGLLLVAAGLGGAIGPLAFAALREGGLGDGVVWLLVTPLSLTALVLFLGAKGPSHR